MFLAANVWCGTMSPYPPAPSPSIRDDSQQQAEDTGHVYKEMERKWYVCNNPKCRKTFTKFAYEIDLAEPNQRFECCPHCVTRFFADTGELVNEPLHAKTEPVSESNHYGPLREITQEDSSSLPSKYDRNLDSGQAETVVQRASKRVASPHLRQQDYELEVLALLSETTTPMPIRVIIQELERRMKGRFSEADLEPTGGTKGKRNTPRWKATARFAIYVGLKKKGLISAVSKNQWVITAKGRELISKKM